MNTTILYFLSYFNGKTGIRREIYTFMAYGALCPVVIIKDYSPARSNIWQVFCKVYVGTTQMSAT